ncbi:MAG: hypothetical protein KBA81_07480 [Rhabdochlamydiaceae bacterium]|nr:hypothetical protein [Rhabdochlamydiaceae bacterium]
MFKIGANRMLINRLFSAFPSCQTSKRSYIQVTMKSDDAFNNIKWDEHLAKKAVDLIFSERKYPDFTSEEKKIVDSYQEKLLEVDGGTILPNTGADIEQQEIQQILLMRKNLKK